MERRSVLKAVAGGGIGLGGAYWFISCGDIPEYDQSDSGRRVTIEGNVETKSRDGSHLSLSDDDQWVSVYPRGSVQSYVANEVETGDCVSAEGRLDVGGDSVTLRNADI